MSKINVTKWKEFKVGDIIDFNSSIKIYHAEYLDILDEPADSNYHPYVVRSAFNNGIRGYIREDPNTLNPANTISFAQDTAQLFYQSEPYFTGNKIKICTVNGVTLNKNIALFLITALLKGFNTFNYDSSFNINNLSRVNIKLPVNSIGQPDWNYMDAYIDKLATQAHQNLNSLRKLKPQKHIINTQQWKKFKVEDLFNVNSSKKKFNAKSVVFDGNYPYIARGASTNGIRGYIDEDPKYLNPANTISFGQDTATLYYQEKPYFTGDKIQILSLKPWFPKLDEYIAQFLITSMNIAFSTYTWGVQSFAVDKIRNVSFKLPVTANNVPDWQYMRQSIIRIQKNVKFNLNTLAKI